MSFNIKEILTAFMVLFAVIDIVGNIPIIIDLRKKAGHIQSEKASIIAGVIMIIFLFLGDSILNFVVADLLFKKFNDLDEGDLSRLGSQLVKAEPLSKLGNELKIGDFLNLSENISLM